MIAGSWLLRRVVRKEYIYIYIYIIVRHCHMYADTFLSSVIWHSIGITSVNTSVTSVLCVLLLLPLVQCDFCQGERLPHSTNSHIDPYDYWITMIVANIVVNMTSISVVFLTVHATLQFVFTLNNYIPAWCLQNMITEWTFPLFTNVANIYIQSNLLIILLKYCIAVFVKSPTNDVPIKPTSCICYLGSIALSMSLTPSMNYFV